MCIHPKYKEFNSKHWSIWNFDAKNTSNSEQDFYYRVKIHFLSVNIHWYTALHNITKWPYSWDWDQPSHDMSYNKSLNHYNQHTGDEWCKFWEIWWSQNKVTVNTMITIHRMSGDITSFSTYLGGDLFLAGGAFLPLSNFLTRLTGNLATTFFVLSTFFLDFFTSVICLSSKGFSISSTKLTSPLTTSKIQRTCTQFFGSVS